jgi:nucleoside-diphosphate-sugar epimerase
MATKVLVAGGAGYIGCKLVPALLQKGYRVKVFDKLLFGDEGLAAVRDMIELEVGDLINIRQNSLAGVDAVINLSGLSNDPTAEYNPEANRLMNTEATLHLARLCKTMGIRRYIFASSCSIYYSLTPCDDLRDEDHPVDPKAPYSYSKYQAERGLLELTDARFCPVMLRKGTVFGQSPRMRYDLVVNVFTRDAFNNRRVILHNKGKMWRPMLNINDAVRAYLATLELPEDKIRGKIFNVLNDNYQVRQIAYQVRHTLEVLKGVRIDLQLQEIGPVRSYRVDNSRFREVSGLRFENNMGASVEEMWDALEDGLDFTNPIHYNLPWLELLLDMERRLKLMDYTVLSSPRPALARRLA